MQNNHPVDHSALSKRHNLFVIAITVVFLLTATSLAAQRSIPGVSSRFDTNEMIDDIIEAESAPIRRNEQRIESLEMERRAWQQLGRNLAELRDSADALFGFRNPFADRRAASSDSSVLSAEANREAPRSTTDIEVVSIAQADVFRSESIPQDFRVPSGTYRFQVGERDVAVRFEGGSLQDFSAAINRRAGEILEVRTIRDTATTRVLVFESRIPGRGNPLSFHEAAETLAVDTGTIAPAAAAADFDVSLDPSSVATEDGDRGGAEVQNGTVTVGPTGSARIDIAPRAEITPQLRLRFEIEVRNLGEPQHTEPQRPTGPAVPSTGETRLDGIAVPFSESIFELPDWTAPEPPVEVEDLRIVSLADGEERYELPEFADTDGFVAQELPIGEVFDGLTAIELENRNTFREVSIRNVEVFDPDSRGEFEPARALQTASDAQLRVDGVEVTRDTNEISDLVDDVTLRLTGPGSVRLDVEPDFDRIKDSVIEFLALYNQLMTEINILTRSSRDVIDQISWFSDEEVEAAEERLGLMQGDTTLNQLRSRLQTIMMNPYETRSGSELRLLQQIGVSSNAGGVGGGVDTRQLRGYLELDEEVMDAAISRYYRSIRDLFGSDTSGDGVINAGAAYEVSNYVRGFTQTGGIVATRNQSIDRRISDANDQIDRDSQRLARREDQLRQEFGRMEGAIDSMEDMQRQLDGLNNQRQ